VTRYLHKYFPTSTTAKHQLNSLHTTV